VEVHEGSVNRSGYFAQIMYNLEDIIDIPIQPIIKYESYEADWTKDKIENVITFGVNYFFNDWTRLQFNYLYKSENSKSGNESHEIANDEILMQLQVKF
jgi:phosphate-selective porin OprO and OprP